MIRRGAPIAFSLVVLAASPAAATGGPAAPGGKAGGGSAKAECLAAHEDAQSLRTQKKPHAAREKLIACARVECPTVVRKECGEQLELLDKDAPTVVLEARDESGRDTTAVKVSLDGQPVAARLTGAAVDVEPGPHVFRFERGDGKDLELRVLVVEGEKNRKVVADFAALVRPPEVPPPPRERRSIPSTTFVAGGVALAAVGSFTFFALVGQERGEEPRVVVRAELQRRPAEAREARLSRRRCVARGRHRRCGHRGRPRMAGAHGFVTEARRERRTSPRTSAMDAACERRRVAVKQRRRFGAATEVVDRGPCARRSVRAHHVPRMPAP